MQPETGRTEGTAATAAPHTSPGAILQRKIPETRTHQAGTSPQIRQLIMYRCEEDPRLDLSDTV